MNVIINVSQSRIGDETVNVVNARDLHEFLEVKTNFRDWIARRIADYGFLEEKDFRSFLSETSVGRPSQEYAITIDMAKELSMVERNDRGKQAHRGANQVTVQNGSNQHNAKEEVQNCTSSLAASSAVTFLDGSRDPSTFSSYRFVPCFNCETRPARIARWDSVR